MAPETKLQPRQDDKPPQFTKSRLYWGGIILVIGLLSPLCIPLVAYLDMPDELKVAFSGFLLLGIPEILMLIAVAIMGDAGYQYLKAWFLRLLGRYGPAEHVSALRYRIGLWMFVVPLLFGFVTPYIDDLLPWQADYKLQVAFALDLLLLLSLFVLGGEFWDKLRGLFSHKATILLPGMQRGSRN